MGDWAGFFADMVPNDEANRRATIERLAREQRLATDKLIADAWFVDEASERVLKHFASCVGKEPPYQLEGLEVRDGSNARLVFGGHVEDRVDRFRVLEAVAARCREKLKGSGFTVYAIDREDGYYVDHYSLSFQRSSC